MQPGQGLTHNPALSAHKFQNIVGVTMWRSYLKSSAPRLVPSCSVWSHLEQEVQSLLNGSTSLLSIQCLEIPEIPLEYRPLLSLSMVMGTTCE